MVQERRKAKVIWELGSAPHEIKAANEVFTFNVPTSSIDPTPSVPETDAVPSGLLKTLEAYGVPRVANAQTALEEAVELLRVAAEIEHALMVEYLFAWLSIKEGSDFQSGIRKVAIQEMGHLMSVQNLAMTLGASPYFARQDASPQPEIDPFPFSLRPLDIHMLAKAVAAEMPSLDDVPDVDKALVMTIQALAHAEVGDDVNRVGVLYAKIYWLFQSSDNPEGPLQFTPKEAARLRESSVAGHLSDADFINPTVLADRQVNIDEFPNLGAVQLTIETPRDRMESLNAIYDVMEEGEGAISDDDSHFNEFLDLYKKYSTSPPTTYNVKIDLTSSDYPAGSTLRALSELSNLRYELMLFDFTLWLSTSRAEHNGAALRERAASWALAEMQVGVTKLSQSLLKRPMEGTASNAVAAPTFELPSRTIPSDFNDQLVHLKALINQAEELIAIIEANGDLDVDDTDMLAVFKAVDADRTEFINEYSLIG